MKVRIDIGLDMDGVHSFDWEPSTAPGALEVPKSTLDRWAEEREAFRVAHLRWRSVVEEIEEMLFKAERNRMGSDAQALAAAVAAKKSH